MQYTSESFALAGVKRYWDYWTNRISNTDPAHSKWSGYCSIYFTDEDADGRQDSSEVARVSGKVDAMRLPKEIYFAHRVMQNEQPDLHILGHWSYPDRPQPDGAQDGEDGLRHCEHGVGGTVRQRQIAGRELEAGQRLDLRVSRSRVCSGQPEGCGQERRQGRGAAGTDHSRTGGGDQADADRRAEGAAGRRRGRCADRLRGGGREGPALPDRRCAGRLHVHRAGNLARRIQQRQDRLDQQPVPEHRSRDQSRCRALDADGGDDYGHGQARRVEAGAGAACVQAGSGDGRHRDVHAAAPSGSGGEVGRRWSSRAAHDEARRLGVAVVARATACLRETEAGIEGDSAGAGGADFEDHFGCAVGAAPVENGVAQGAADTGAPGAGGDHDAFQFGDCDSPGLRQARRRSPLAKPAAIRIQRRTRQRRGASGCVAEWRRKSLAANAGRVRGTFQSEDCIEVRGDGRAEI